MLSWFRDKAKIFLIVIIVMFVGLIFVGWGTGNFGDDRADRGAIAKVDGTRLMPDQLLDMRASLYQQMKRQQEMMRNPAPDNELAFLEPQLEEEAFDSLVAGVLIRDYLENLGWPRIDRELAETFLLEQLRLSGQEDPETLLDSYRQDPSYNRQLYRVMTQMSMMRLPAQIRLESVASARELEFFNQAMLSSVEARYIAFRASPEPPDPDTLRDFYDSNPSLFVDPETSVLQYITVLVAPSAEDRDLAAAEVDSMALSAAPGADTMTVTRRRLGEYTDQASELSKGDITTPVEMQGGMGSAMHSWSVLEVREAPESLLAAQDSLTVAHWQVPVRPSQPTIRETMWALEEQSEELIDMEMPLSDSLMVIDFGETTVTPGSRLSGILTEGLKAYALDSSWVGEISPIFYIPSYGGAYPALTVVKKLSWWPCDTLSYQETMDSGRLELEAYSAARRTASVEMATAALEEIRTRAMALADYAESESLEVRTTESFVPIQIISAAETDPEAVSGLMANRRFGLDAMLMPELEPMGPYATGGAAVVAEIYSREVQTLPEEARPIRYLSLQHMHSRIYRRSLLELLRQSAEVVDLREEYVARVDSIQAARDSVEAVPSE